MRDYQKSRVYAWEHSHLANQNRTYIDIEQARNIVTYIWQEEDLHHPPKVEAISKQAKILGNANRKRIKLQPLVPIWIILHELSHTLNSSLENTGDGHGPDYVGIYMRLLTNYLKLPLPMLIYSAMKSRVEFNLDARYSVL